MPEDAALSVTSTGVPFPDVPVPVLPFLSVIVTALHEEASIERLLNRVVAVSPRDVEILVVDGGTDRTGEIVQQVASVHPGSGTSGMRMATGKGTRYMLALRRLRPGAMETRGPTLSKSRRPAGRTRAVGESA